MFSDTKSKLTLDKVLNKENRCSGLSPTFLEPYCGHNWKKNKNKQDTKNKTPNWKKANAQLQNKAILCICSHIVKCSRLNSHMWQTLVAKWECKTPEVYHGDISILPLWTKQQK